MKQAFKRFVKAFGQSPFGQRSIGRLLGAVIWVTQITSRVEVRGLEPMKKTLKDGPALVLFWHSRLMMMPYLWGHKIRIHRAKAITSPHRDGQIIAQILACFDIPSIPGSSNQGGTEAFRNALRNLKKNISVAITPDGPRGPYMRINSNVFHIARLAQAPVFLIAISADHVKILNTWDRFLLIKPFSRVLMEISPPIHVPKSMSEQDVEQIRKNAEELLNTMTQHGDKEMGLPLIRPEQD